MTKLGQELAYRFVYGVVFLVSKLPMSVLYGFSNLLSWLAREVIGYRKSVIQANLKRAFPERSDADRGKLARAFYDHFCDFLVETLKSLTLSDQELARRMELTNPEVLETILSEPRGSILLGSHHGNFEWMLARIDLMARGHLPTFAIYTPLSSPVFNRLMLRLRQRRSVEMLPMRKAMIQALRQLSSPCLFGFIGDQSPSRGGATYFTPFFDQPTAAHTSIAKIALRAQANLYYAEVRKKRRGYYTLTLVRIDTQAFLPYNQTQVFTYTDYQNAVLEASIREQPAYWLWSHKRWKHSPRESDTVSERVS